MYKLEKITTGDVTGDTSNIAPEPWQNDSDIFDSIHLSHSRTYTYVSVREGTNRYIEIVLRSRPPLAIGSSGLQRLENREVS